MPQGEEDVNDNYSKTDDNGWAAFSMFKKTGNTVTKKNSSPIIKLLYFLAPMLLVAIFYQYSVVKGSTFFGLSLRHNIDLESGLVGYWTFDGPDVTDKVYDLSGQGNHGTFVGGATTSAKAIGKVGQAMQFDGGDDYISIPTFNETFSEITITAWVRRQSGVAAYNGIVFSRNFPNIAGLLLSDSYPGDTLAYVWSGSAPWNSGLVLPYDTWTFVALTVAPTLGKVYVGTNNNLSSSTNAITHNPNTFDELKIGVNDDAPSHWDGGIDDVRIYNRALTVREIEALYKQGEGSKISVTPPTITALENGLMAHLTFDGADILSAASTIGETGIAVNNDSGNGDLLLAQIANTAQTIDVSTMSFYVTTAVGDLRLGIYDDNGPGNQPGTLLASTTSFTPTTGWNTQNLVTPVTLPAGNYWLAYLPQSSSLGFKNNSGGNLCYYSYSFGAMPSTFDTSPTCVTATFSLYAGSQSGALDMSGNGNVGEINGAVTTIGKNGQALRFDGVDDNVYINTISGLSGATDVPFSWSFWLNTETTSVDDIIGWSAYRSCTIVSWLTYSIMCTVDGDASDNGVQSTSDYLNDGQWHHVVYTHNSGQQALYIDGNLEDTASEPFSSASTGFMIGARPFGDNIGGSFDDIRIYNRALSADEVTKLYNLENGTRVNVTPTTNDTGLVGHWTFDGPDVTDKVYDLSGQGNHGGFYGGATTSAKTIGKIGQGLKFDGVDDEVWMGDPSSLRLSSVGTVAVWVKPQTLEDDWDILVNHLFFTTDRNGYSIFIDRTRDGSKFNLEIANASSYNRITASSSAISGEWQHVTGVWDGSYLRIYVNGVQEGSPIAQTVNATTGNELDIGISNAGAYAFDGSLDDVRIYNRALSTAEILKLYNAGR